MPRVYLETSFISACVTDRADAASVYRRETSLEWWQTKRHAYELFVSPEVLDELDVPGFRHRIAALALVSDMPVLAVTPEAIGFGEILVRHKVMPGPVTGDAMHVALACIHEMDFILSWNVRHLANPNKVRHLQNVCISYSLRAPRIVTPDFLWSTSS